MREIILLIVALVTAWLLETGYKQDTVNVQFNSPIVETHNTHPTPICWEDYCQGGRLVR